MLLALERLSAECTALVDSGIQINEAIHHHKLPAPPLDLAGLANTRQSAIDLTRTLREQNEADERLDRAAASIAATAADALAQREGLIPSLSELTAGARRLR